MDGDRGERVGSGVNGSRFAGVAARLRDSIEAEPRLRRDSGDLPPSRGEVARALDCLLGLVFPGYEHMRSADEHLPEGVSARLERMGGELTDLLTRVCGDCHRDWAEGKVEEYFGALPRLRQLISLDVQAAVDGDPSCHDATEAILCLPGVHAVATYRLAHEWHALGVPLLPRLIGSIAQERTGIDIHPAARIGQSFFIDHGIGVVIGETARVGDHCKLYQGVTLGARSFRRGQRGQIEREPKRHPTLEDHVTVYAGATILGGETVIGAGSAIGGGVFVTESVPAGHVVYQAMPEVRTRANPDRPAVSYVI